MYAFSLAAERVGHLFRDNAVSRAESYLVWNLTLAPDPDLPLVWEAGHQPAQRPSLVSIAKEAGLCVPAFQDRRGIYFLHTPAGWLTI